MSILITGATGFIGSYVLNALLNQTEYDIVILKRSTSNLFRIKDMLNNVRVRTYNLDEISVAQIFVENNIEAIVHLATEYGRYKHSEINTLKTNLMFPIELINECIKNGCKAFINTDSYFNKENLSYNYLLHYSLSKKSLLLWLKYYSKKIKIANLVLEHPYGAYDGKNKFCETMIQKIAVEKLPSINLTKGKQKRDFIYVKDAANAYIYILNHILSSKKDFDTYYVGTGKSISIKTFVETVKNLSASNTILNFGAVADREDEIMDSFADNQSLISLGWRPKYSLNEGLREILKLYGENNG